MNSESVLGLTHSDITKLSDSLLQTAIQIADGIVSFNSDGKLVETLGEGGFVVAGALLTSGASM